MVPLSNVQYWRSPFLPGLEVACVNRSAHHFPRHFHDGIYSIGIMDEGASYCLKEGDESSLTTPWSLALINPGQLHTGIPVDHKRVSYRMIYIDDSLFRDCCYEITGLDKNWEFTEFISRDPGLRSRFFNLSRVIIQPDSLLNLESELILAIALLMKKDILESCRIDTFRESPLSRAAEILESELERSISLEQISRELGLSRYHFLRTFKKNYGVTPHVYRIQARLEKARALMGENIPLSEISCKVGFSDQSHFSRTFSRYYGATPLQYASSL